jgi:hypothetical protein
MSVKRSLIKSLPQLMKQYPVVALTGPRQSGKTTLLKNTYKDFRYVSLENPDIRNFAELDPNSFLKEYDQHVIFDEVQRVPQLFSYLQQIIDESGKPGQFILSGSQNFHLMQSITQSLAGRVAMVKLFPFDHNEMKSAGLLDEEFFLSNLFRGYYPAIFDRNIPPKTFYYNYVQTYIQRDVSELINIRNMRLFQNFLGLCAARAGQLLNLNALANECGISQPTAKAWLSALEQSYILFQLQPYYKNFSKRIVKTPKLYFYDTGLLCYLLKIKDSAELNLHVSKGALFENMMVAEYVKQMYHKNEMEDLWFWRDASGNEIDLMIDGSKNITIVEMKATTTIKSDMFKGLLHFEKISKFTNLKKQLVYGGNQSQKRSVAQVISWKDFTTV